MEIFKTSGEINFITGDIMIIFNSSFEKKYGIILKEPTKDGKLNVITISKLSKWLLIRIVQVFLFRVKFKFMNNL